MKRIIDKISFRHILMAALLLRLLAAFFSKGYAFHDDHFGVIELTQQWKQGIPFNWTGGDVYIFSLIYPGFHYLVFSACDAVGIKNPQEVMLVVRVIHAFLSMLSVYYAWYLTLRLTDNNFLLGKIVSLLMAAFWIFPFMAVRNLAEFFCIPFILMGSYYAADNKISNRAVLLSALFFAIAFCLRMQTIFIPFVVGVCWLFQKNAFKKAFLFGFAFGGFLFLTQGLFDIFLYGNPLASISAYFNYNADPENIQGYPQGPWYQYIGTLAGVCLGFSFLPLLWGYIQSARISFQTRVLFLSSLLFFIFHSYYANKQERFILPFIPYFLLLGVIGFYNVYEKFKKNAWFKSFTRFCIGWFIILNTAGLMLITFTYSKKSRVEAMTFLRGKKDVNNFIIEGGDVAPPLFYLGKFIDYISISTNQPNDSILQKLRSRNIPTPNYIILIGNKNLAPRIARFKVLFPAMHQVADIKPGMVDNFAYYLNPKHNENDSWLIYKTE